MRWRLDDRTTLKRVALDELTAIFDRRSGQTHIVAPPTPDLIDALGPGAADVTEVLHRLGISDPSHDEIAATDARLIELEATGLVLRA